MVDYAQWISQVVAEVRKPGSQEIGCQRTPDLRGRVDDCILDSLVEVLHDAVVSLQRIGGALEKRRAAPRCIEGGLVRHTGCAKRQ